MNTDKNLSQIKAIVLRHKWLIKSDEDQVTPTFFTGKGGREPHGIKSSGVIEKAIQFVREHKGVRIIVVLDDPELLMRDGVWFPQLQNSAMDMGKTTVIIPGSNMIARNPECMVIRASAVDMNETDEHRGPKNPRLVEAWRKAYWEVTDTHDSVADTSNGWVSIEAQIRGMDHVLSDADLRYD